MIGPEGRRAYLQINPEDMVELGLKAGDLVQVYNDLGATQAMVWPEATARRKDTFILFGAPTDTQGDVINAGANELIPPNDDQTWAITR